jgi:hypothetical protein
MPDFMVASKNALQHSTASLKMKKHLKNVAMATKVTFSDSPRVVDISTISNCRNRTTLRKVGLWRENLTRSNWFDPEEWSDH